MTIDQKQITLKLSVAAGVIVAIIQGTLWLAGLHEEAMGKFREALVVGRNSDQKFDSILGEVKTLREDLTEVRERQARIEGKLDVQLRRIK